MADDETPDSTSLDNVGLTSVPPTPSSVPSTDGGPPTPDSTPPPPPRRRRKQPDPDDNLLTHPQDIADLPTTTPPPTPDSYSPAPSPFRGPPGSRPGPPQPLNRSLAPSTLDIPTADAPQGLPNWKLMSPSQLQSMTFGPASSIVSWDESRNRNVRQDINGKTGPGSGLLQIEDPTWRQYAPQLGVNLNKYPTAMSAPPQVQLAVGRIIPINQWAANTRNDVYRAFPWATPNMTLGQIDQYASGARPQRYVPASEDRPPEDWGRLPPLPPLQGGGGGFSAGPGILPTSFDMSMLMMRGRGMHRWMSTNVAFASLLMLNSWAGYQRALQSGQLWQAGQQAQSWKQNLADTRDRMEEEAMDMSSVYAAYGPDKEHPDRFDIQAFQQAVGQVAAKYGDGILNDSAGDPRAVERLMQARDKYFVDLSKANQAQQKADADQKKQEAADRKEAENERRGDAYIGRERAASDLDYAKIRKMEMTPPPTVETNPYLASPGSNASPPAASTPGPQSSATPPSAPNNAGVGAGGTQTAAAPGSTSGTAPQAGDSGDGGDEEEQQPASDEEEKPEEGGEDEQQAQATPEQQARPTQLAAAAPPVTDADSDDGQITQTAGPPLRRTAPGTVPALDATSPTPQQTQYPLGPAMRALGPNGQTLARQYLRDPEALKNVPMENKRDYRTPIVNATAELQRSVDDVYERANTGDLSRIPDPVGRRKAIMKALDDIDPDVAADLNSMLDYYASGRTGIAGRTSASSPYLHSLINLAPLAKPSWQPANIQHIQEFGARNGRIQQTMQLATTTASTGATVLRDLTRISGNDNAFKNAVDSWIKTGEGSPAFTSLIGDWQQFVIEANRLRTYTGSVQESEQQTGVLTPGRGESIMLRGVVPESATQFRDMIKNELGNSWPKVQGFQEDWASFEVPYPMPGQVWINRGGPTVTAIQHMDSSTGNYRNITTLPDELLGTGRIEKADPDDAAALNWARQHLDDPKSIDILRGLRAKGVI